MRSVEIWISSTRDQKGNGLIWLAYTLIGGLFPLYAGIFVLLLFSSVQLSSFVDHGEFAVYSTGLLSAALLIVLTDYGQQPFPDKRLWAMTILGFIIIATLIFSVVATSGLDGELQEQVNLGLIRILSVGLYVLTVVLMFFVVVLDKVMPDIDKLNNLRSEGQNDLAEQVRKLGGQ